MKSGIYCLKWYNSGHFYIGKSEDIPKRWQQHKKDFEKGQHAKNMQQCYDIYGSPEYEVFLTCHRDHCDLYESIIIRANLTDYCLNKAIPAEVPAAEREILVAAGDYCCQSTSEHIQQIELLKGDKERLEQEIADRKVISRKKHDKLVNELNHEVYQLRVKMQDLDQYVQRLDRRNWWQRLLNSK